MEQFITIIGILLTLLLVGSWVFLYFSLKRALDRNTNLEEEIIAYENQNAEALTANEQLYTWFEEFKARTIDAYQRIKSIDASGHFEADDEVGYFFKELKSLIERLHALGIMDETEKEKATTINETKITTEELQKVLSKRNSAILTGRKE
jgi:hypothetical protein